MLQKSYSNESSVSVRVNSGTNYWFDIFMDRILHEIEVGVIMVQLLLKKIKVNTVCVNYTGPAAELEEDLDRMVECFNDEYRVVNGYGCRLMMKANVRKIFLF